MDPSRDGTAVSLSEDSDGEQSSPSPAPASSAFTAASEASGSSPRTVVYETRDEDGGRSETLSPTGFDDTASESSSQSTAVTTIDVDRQRQMDAEQPRETDDSGSDGPPSRHRSPSRVPSEAGEFPQERGAAINEGARTDGDETGTESAGVDAEEVSSPRQRMASATEIPACKERAIAPVLVNTGVAQFVPGLISNIIWLVLCAISFMWKASMAAPDPAERANKRHPAPRTTVKSETECDKAEQSSPSPLPAAAEASGDSVVSTPRTLPYEVRDQDDVRSETLSPTGLASTAQRWMDSGQDSDGEQNDQGPARLDHSSTHRASVRETEVQPTELFPPTDSPIPCGAPTKSGAPCKRKVKEQGQRCHLHR